MSVRKSRTLPAEMSEDQRVLYEKIANGSRAAESAFPLVDDDGALTGPFDAMLLAPALGEALQSVGSALRFHGSLTNRAREFAILLVAHHQDSSFEVDAHEAVGRRIGLTEADLSDLADGLPPQDADEYEIAVIDLTNLLLRGTELDDASYKTATDRLGEATVFEISTLVGYYSLLALQLRIFAP